MLSPPGTCCRRSDHHPAVQALLQLPLPSFLSGSGYFYDSAFGIITSTSPTQCGFCVFVLSNYMRTIPREISEAGAGRRRAGCAAVPRSSCRVPAGLAALATLESSGSTTTSSVADPHETGTSARSPRRWPGCRRVLHQSQTSSPPGRCLTCIPSWPSTCCCNAHFVGGLTIGASKT